MTDTYAVIGHPIAHSKSPSIHTSFAQSCQQDMVYDRLLAPVDGFLEVVEGFFADGGKGLNVTMPFKEQAYAFAKDHTPRALSAGAVNTLFIHPDTQEVWGDNTDGAGLVTDICQNHGFDLKGKRVLLLGAGGAVRGVLQPIFEQQPSSVTIANRTVAKAEHLAELVSEFGQVNALGFNDLTGSFDLIINGTSASLENALPPIATSCIASHTWCYDMMYSAEPTVFCRWAVEQGAANAVDGLGMLVEQAAESFERWRGVRPDTRLVNETLRKELKQG